jgi:hypothetical protein
VMVGTSNVSVAAFFKSKNGANCGGGEDCDSRICVKGTCCKTACTGACDGSCATGTCNPLPARTACGTLPGPGGTGSDIAQICDGAGNCGPPTVQCPTGLALVSCDLSTNVCCYPGNSRNESCMPATNACPWYGQNCAATADCPIGLYCCQVYLPSGNPWAVCTASANCTAQQLCDPTATTSGCLTGSCVDGFANGASICE